MKNEMTSGQSDQGLGWLLEDFVARVPGVDSALLASRDGLKLALAGLTRDQAETTAAVMSGLYSLAKGVGNIKESSRGGVRQIVIEHDTMNLFVMSAGDGVPPGVDVQLGTDPRTVGKVLGVLAKPGADAGVIGYEMTKLITSVAEHMVTPTRRSDAPSGDGQ